MRNFIALFLICFLFNATVAQACEDCGQNGIGASFHYLDCDSHFDDSSPGVIHQIYFYLVNCSEPFLSAYEFAWRINPAPDPEQIWEFINFPDGYTNFGDNHNIIVGLETPVPTSGLVVLAQVGILFLNDNYTQTGDVQVGPTDMPAVPCQMSFLSPGNPSELIPLQPCTPFCDSFLDENCWTIPGVAVFNQNLPGPHEAAAYQGHENNFRSEVHEGWGRCAQSYGVIEDFGHDYEPPAHQSPGAGGADAVWSLYLTAGMHLWIFIDTDFSSHCLYLVTDCGDIPGSWVASTTGELLVYDPFETGWHHLILDSAPGSTGWFNLDFTPYGPFYQAPTPPEHNTCAGARELPTGWFLLEDNLSNARNTYDPGRDGCTGWGDTGRDVVYRVEMAPGDSLDVTMTTDGDWDDSLYLITDCENPQGSCVAGQDLFPSGSRVTFASGSGGIYWLVCDSYGIGPRPFSLEGYFGPPDPASATDTPNSPLEISLLPCRPNPFNPRTTVSFGVSKAGQVRVDVYSLDGRRVRTLQEGHLAAGWHDKNWDGTDSNGRRVASGTYLVRLETRQGSRTQRAILVQ